MTTIPDEWKDSQRTPFDFIVVGAGAAGAPLAARLVERGYSVLVVEMGPEKPPMPHGAVVENTEVPLLHSETTEDERHSLRFFVKHFDQDPAGSLDPKVHRPPNARRDEEGIFYPRAQGVGGCTIHNAMITICGPSEEWDEIADATGDQSWRGERIRAYFERVERCHYAQPSFWDRFKNLLGFNTGWETARHGNRGWLDTTMADLRLIKRDRQLLKIMLDGAIGSLQAGVERIEDLAEAALTTGASPVLDPNHWETMRQSAEGVRRIPCSISPTGERSGPRQRLLSVKAHPAHGKRLHLLAGVCVTEIELETETNPGRVGGKDAAWRAKGVRCLPREHVYEADPMANLIDGEPWDKQVVTLYCRREVVLCGGTFNTPQLLMLSGIGRFADLSKHDKITTRLELAGVGANLQDRYEVPVTATVTDRFQSLDGICMSSKNLDPELKRWVDGVGRAAFQRGLYATNGVLVSIFKRSSQEDTFPDLVILALAGSFPGYQVGWANPAALLGLPPGADLATAPRRALTWLILKARTRNRAGYVRLQSAHPFRRPEINFRSFPHALDNELDKDNGRDPSNDPDLEALYEGVRYVQNILQVGKDTGTIDSHELPGMDRFGGNVRKWIKHVAWGHHACGTCRIGADDDPDAVLDSRFRVRGVQGLRVVDASAFPRIPGFFIVTNIYMIAEKAADMLSEDQPIDADDLPREAKEALQTDPVLPSRPDFEARRLYPAEMEAAEARLVAARRKVAGL
jgi:choline dehydrogenase